MNGYRKHILNRLKAKAPDKKQRNIYISESLWDVFKAICGEQSPSEVIEEMISDFIEEPDTRIKTRVKR